MRLNIPDDHIHAGLEELTRFVQHGVGFADARRISEEYFESPDFLNRLDFQLR